MTTAILGVPMLEAMHFPGMREFMLRSGEEALELGLLQGYDVSSIFGLKSEDVADREKVVERLLDTVMSGFVLPETTTTVLQDWQKGGRREIDDLNGLVVDRPALAGRNALANQAIVRIANKIEERQAIPSLRNMQVLLNEAMQP
ncbi:ketopantoate reductase family protein [Caballeronia sp.]|uniref:ketopantoate reductase family protein n=1 Tax=Caballeronia sp. TaxID=1931223 RepID=UPI003C4EE168